MKGNNLNGFVLLDSVITSFKKESLCPFIFGVKKIETHFCTRDSCSSNQEITALLPKQYVRLVARFLHWHLSQHLSYSAHRQGRGACTNLEGECP